MFKTILSQDLINQLLNDETWFSACLLIRVTSLSNKSECFSIKKHDLNHKKNKADNYIQKIFIHKI